ncbi:hypothetical protein HETIRDRAFT_163173 [Heterobasidion irregulare TC 32-1]|uniref:Uncharacterized protein n=1 Tax=Heterobasidion irregulare (strain TC 32-1) TaxID=747525 RepID=W4KAC8_HETIT|nr:uncharacterized protein HETIRDRAFT_163173 [Heterobasidion irregulare TC 32-1]ETW82748.1 hypothetical protein HETIRDRAFT_163173 [Heterobasidion irregulare TC 32-1]
MPDALKHCQFTDFFSSSSPHLLRSLIRLYTDNHTQSVFMNYRYQLPSQYIR